MCWRCSGMRRSASIIDWAHGHKTIRKNIPYICIYIPVSSQSADHLHWSLCPYTLGKTHNLSVTPGNIHIIIKPHILLNWCVCGCSEEDLDVCVADLDRAWRLSGSRSSEPTYPPSLMKPPYNTHTNHTNTHTHTHKVLHTLLCIHNVCIVAAAGLTVVRTCSSSSRPSGHRWAPPLPSSAAGHPDLWPSSSAPWISQEPPE